jgi:hypothetical protein
VWRCSEFSVRGSVSAKEVIASYKKDEATLQVVRVLLSVDVDVE